MHHCKMQYSLYRTCLAGKLVFIYFFLLGKEVLQVLLDYVCVASAAADDINSCVVMQQCI